MYSIKRAERKWMWILLNKNRIQFGKIRMSYMLLHTTYRELSPYLNLRRSNSMNPLTSLC